MFVYNAWYVAAWSGDVTIEQPLSRRILGRPVVLYRTASGQVGALEDRCCHRGLPLSMGRVDGDRLQCSYHGLEFDVAGRCVRIPGQDRVPEHMKVRSYPVAEQDRLIWIWTGDAERADVSRIPSFPYHDDPKWPFIPYTQPVACGYQLIIDNLLDQTHVAYVHGKTIGGNAAGHAVADMEIVATPRGMRFMRWLANAPPPPAYVMADIGITADTRVDRWAEFEFVGPCSVLQFVGGLPVARDARGTGEREGGWALRIMHNITPATETTCHYFWGACHGFRQDDPQVTQWMFEQIQSTFQEDEVILEAQQRRILEVPGPLTATKHDAARVRADQALQRMLAEDRTLRGGGAAG